MDDKRTTGWRLSRNQATLFGAIIGYAILVVVVTPLLLGFLPILAVGWMLRVPVASAPAHRAIAAVEVGGAEPVSSVAATTESTASDTITPIASAS
jgi:hypothetical protein